MEFTVEARGLPELQRWAGQIAPDQVRWATALSLTRVAQRSQTQVRLELVTAFILRREQFMKQGVRIVAATKSNLVAHVRDIHRFMGLQETGGSKLPMHGPYLCVPLEGARPRATMIIAPENLPSAVMQRGGFIRGNVMYAKYLTAGKRLARGKYGPLNAMAAGGKSGIVPMYVLVHSANIKPRYGMRETVQDAVDRFYGDEFKKAFAESVGSRKPAR